MVQLIAKEDVAAAMQQLAQAGRKVTVAAVHAALGNKGSLTTVVKLMQDVRAAATPEPQDDPAALEQFRTIWATAFAAGRQAEANAALELRDSINALSADNERLAGEISAAAAATAKAETQRGDLLSQAGCLQADLTKVRASRETDAARITQLLEELRAKEEDHHRELERLSAAHEATQNALREKIDSEMRCRHSIEQAKHEAQIHAAELKAQLKAAIAEREHIAAMLTQANERGHALTLQIAASRPAAPSSRAAKHGSDTPELPGSNANNAPRTTKPPKRHGGSVPGRSGT